MRTIIEVPEKEKRPDSQDPVIYDEKPHFDSPFPGGWGIKRVITEEDYKEILQAWRSQNTNHSKIIKPDEMKKISVQSSSIATIGYDEDSRTLEVGFLNGSAYQYFDVPNGVAHEFMYNPQEGSHGKYLAGNIKGVYRYAKV
jgi:hypothetical protein